MRRLEGKSVEEVVAQYAKEMGIDAKDVNYTVLEEKKGILGLGTKVVLELTSDKEVENFLKEYLDTYFKGLEMDVDVDVCKEDDIFRVDLNADNNAILIGRGGTTLQALNTVVRGAASSTFKKKIQVIVDINGYKEERYERLELTALGVAKTVQRSKQSALLDPMPADERKVIHQYLNNLEHIKTVSEGEGRDRAIRILYTPEKYPNKTEE
ncbi:MAG: KH domain-containing protein [Erysipelotrichales bacterium]|nr:KH domain-containing protein [Erysipelotrichales bacterium]MBQ4375881.1 KH domain-containing protein [Erysipelotrichales bacterium]